MSSSSKSQKSSEKKAQSFELDLRDGLMLRASYVTGHDKPFLGFREGNTFTVLAQFSSDEELAHFHEVMASRIFVIQPLDPAPTQEER